MIKQAIIPLAGLGTRLLPLTSVIPKELLPVNGKPNIEYILEECIDAGIKEFIFIISIGMYFVNIYNNMIACYTFYKNINKIRNYLISINKFLKYSIDSINNINQYCKSSYTTFININEQFKNNSFY